MAFVVGRPIKDLTGQIFGQLTVLSRVMGKRDGTHTVWLCQCACGKQLEVRGSSLTSYGQEACRPCGKKTHGFRYLKTFQVWRDMVRRCTNPNHPNFEDYSKRGVCQEWLASYEQFVVDMGEPPTPYHTLERKDNELGYSKDNCRWATMKEQAQNRRPARRASA